MNLIKIHEVAYFLGIFLVSSLQPSRKAYDGQYRGLQVPLQKMRVKDDVHHSQACRFCQGFESIQGML